MVRYGLYGCPLGTMAIGYEDHSIISVKLVCGAMPEHQPSSLSDLAAAQLQEYFDGKRKRFHFPIALKGTDFQRSVWSALLQIPYGETRTYGEIAAMIGNPKASRAVGMACNRNPIWIIVPCHRVVGKGGTLTGFEGGLDVKSALLELEQHNR